MTLNISKVYLTVALVSIPANSPLILLIASAIYTFTDYKFHLGAMEKKVILPIIAIIFLAAFSSADLLSYNAAKDIFYLASPLFYFTAGHRLYRSYKDKIEILLRHIIFACIVSGSFQLLLIGYGFIFSGITNYDLLRTEYGRGVLFISFLSGCLIGNTKKNHPKIPAALKYIFITTGIILTFSTLSRTSIFSFFFGLVLSSTLTGKISLSKLIRGIIFVFSFSSIAIIFSLQNEWFHEKVTNTFNEIAFVDLSQANRQEIVKNWRSYENALTLNLFYSSDIQKKLFGLGHGSSISFTEEFNLSTGESFEAASILHNAFAYIWMKSGLVGILLYLLIFATLVKSALRTMKTAPIELKSLILGSVLILFFCSFSITGIYNRLQAPIFIIILTCFYNMSVRNEKNCA
jgi:hypothetical protein